MTRGSLQRRSNDWFRGALCVLIVGKAKGIPDGRTCVDICSAGLTAPCGAGKQQAPGDWDYCSIEQVRHACCHSSGLVDVGACADSHALRSCSCRSTAACWRWAATAPSPTRYHQCRHDNHPESCRQLSPCLASCLQYLSTICRSRPGPNTCRQLVI